MKNKKKIEKIVNALELKNGDTIVEIGPGHGELTNELRIRNYELRILAIEKDAKLTKRLQQKFRPYKNIEIIQGDILRLLLSVIRNSSFKIQNYKIVGNIPYYITGRLFRLLSELKNKPKLIVLTIQKEVAERICAKPPKMNLLAASVQFWAAPKIIDFISKDDFQPRPKVDSAILKLIPIPSIPNPKPYYSLIKILFKQPRKTIHNNLKSGLNLKNEELIKKLSELNVNPQERPQNLSVGKLKKLAELLYN